MNVQNSSPKKQEVCCQQKKGYLWVFFLLDFLNVFERLLKLEKDKRQCYNMPWTGL